jgi:hypothetical protein
MRSPVRSIIGAMALVCASACTPEDPAHTMISLQPPYSHLPLVPAGSPIEAGTTVTLDARLQESVVVGVARWLKDPGSAHFGAMAGARNSRGTITVCGLVAGRNGVGAYVGMMPYVGVIMGTSASPDFVVVGIGGSARERAEVTSLCRESGVAQLS